MINGNEKKTDESMSEKIQNDMKFPLLKDSGAVNDNVEKVNADDNEALTEKAPFQKNMAKMIETREITIDSTLSDSESDTNAVNLVVQESGKELTHSLPDGSVDVESLTETFTGRENLVQIKETSVITIDSTDTESDSSAVDVTVEESVKKETGPSIEGSVDSEHKG